MPEALSPAPVTGRVFRWPARVGVADATPDGRVRLDALARILQDAAFGDVRDAHVTEEGGWVVRRCRMVVEAFPGFDEALEVRTWCPGLGAAWAERRTTVLGERGGRVEALALWVHLDAATGRPLLLSPRVRALYPREASGRRVSARLRHPRPPAVAPATDWFFRATDLDVAGHVNNAAYWEVLEEELADAAPAAGLDVEMEHRDAAPAGPARVLGDGARRWIAGDDGTLFASLVRYP